MDAPGVKPRHNWCKHADPGHGCMIYNTRPDICRDFHCQWVIDNRHPDYWFPAKSKIVINATIEKKHKYVTFIVDPNYPMRWQEEPYVSDIKKIAQAGIEGRLGEKWTTIVMVGEERIPIIGSERLLRAAG
jgi:hypothetical protein